MSEDTTPQGQLADTVTYLEMTERPSRVPRATPAGRLALMRVAPCPTGYYRYLYAAVGEPWLWFERRMWSDAALAQWLAREETELTVLYVGGAPAGYFELDRLASGETELAYFGLVSDFIGQGLGTWLLEAAVDSTWQGATRRVWVHTCTFDHPRALGAYQRAGFRVYDRKSVVFDDPRLTGVLPRDYRHPLLPPLSP